MEAAVGSRLGYEGGGEAAADGRPRRWSTAKGGYGHETPACTVVAAAVTRFFEHLVTENEKNIFTAESEGPLPEPEAHGKGRDGEDWHAVNPG